MDYTRLYFNNRIASGKQYKSMKRQTNAQRIQLQLRSHMTELYKLGYKATTLKPLLNLERKANKWATDECNGTREYTEKQWQNLQNQVLNLFTDNLLDYGFFINRDPRGYALKLKDGANKISYQDWGRYEILAPEFN